MYRIVCCISTEFTLSFKPFKVEKLWYDENSNMFIFNVVVKRLDLEKTMKFSVTINRDEDGMWIVECPAIPGCVSQGKPKDEALVNIKDAIQLCLQVRAEHGLPLTIETRQIEVAA